MIKLKSLLTEHNYTVYRGDEVKFKQFDKSFIGQSTQVNTAGFWFTDSPEAAGFFGQYIRRYNIVMNNPLEVSYEEFLKEYPKGPPDWAMKAKRTGHDGVIIHDITDGDTESTVYCVFEPHQAQRYEQR